MKMNLKKITTTLLLYGSALLPVMFLFCLSFFCQKAQAWNEDYAYGLPRQRRMCVQRTAEDKIHFTSILQDEDCPPGSKRYVVVFGKEPRGSIALLPSTTSLQFYPPLVLSWPAKEETSNNHLWHFTCVAPHEITVLESKISMKKYKGEITSLGGNDCLESAKRALKFCQDQWHGEELLESCPLSLGGP